MTKNDIPAGTQFGHLTVLAPTNHRSGYNLYFLCNCACGSEVEIMGSHLLYSNTISCGCARRRRPVTVDATTRRLRHAWRHMLDRCYKSSCDSYPHYGGRGITVCQEWRESFEAFKAWALANDYADDLTIERIDNDGNYEPQNCRWATIAEQNGNTSRVRRVTAYGETKAIAEWARDVRCMVSYHTLYRRIVNLGWDVEKALETCTVH